MSTVPRAGVEEKEAVWHEREGAGKEGGEGESMSRGGCVV